VAGNAAYLVNPEKTEEIGVGLKRLASDGMLVNTLIQRGEERLAKYSWEKAAKETFEVLFGD
jgi:glycosyltransferase involved in cell wall biosynthesis